MAANPYEPSARNDDGPSTFRRIYQWMRMPFPVRVDDGNSFMWLLDVLVALVLWLVGCGIAGVSSQILNFLDPIAYSVGLMIGWFPLGMWIHYCGVSRFNRLSAVIMIVLLMAVTSAIMSTQALRCLPLSFAILAFILPCEHLLGKMILSRLPSSSARKQREPSDARQALDRPF